VILLVRSAEARYVELDWDAWAHARERHPEIYGSLSDVVMTIERPMHREPDRIPGRERLYHRVPAHQWMRVVLEFSGDFDRFVTAFLQFSDPRPRQPR
jgi:hypothetical protein